MGVIFDKLAKSQISHGAHIAHRAQRYYIDIIHFVLAFFAALFAPPAPLLRKMVLG